jgi:anti-anti-sigma factor
LIPGTGLQKLPRLAVCGYIDLTTAEQFADAIRAATEGRRVILDLTDAEFVSSVAINVLFQRRQSLAGVLVGADTIVARALSLAGFPTIPVNPAAG